jgi:hypothetical protein
VGSIVCEADVCYDRLDDAYADSDEGGYDSGGVCDANVVIAAECDEGNGSGKRQ